MYLMTYLIEGACQADTQFRCSLDWELKYKHEINTSNLHICPVTLVIQDGSMGAKFWSQHYFRTCELGSEVIAEAAWQA